MWLSDWPIYWHFHTTIMPETETADFFLSLQKTYQLKKIMLQI